MGPLQSAQAGMDMNMPGFVGYGKGDQNQQDPAVNSSFVYTLLSLRLILHCQNANNSFWGHALIDFVQDGSLPEWRVTDMVTRTMAAFFKMGQDQNYPPVKYVSHHLSLRRYT